MTDYNDEIYGFPLEKKYIDDEEESKMDTTKTYDEEAEEIREECKKFNNHESILEQLSVEVKKADGADAKIEVLMRQVDLLATLHELTNIAIDTLVEEVGRLKKKNKKLNKKIKFYDEILVTHSELIEKIAEQNKDLHEIFSHITD